MLRMRLSDSSLGASSFSGSILLSRSSSMVYSRLGSCRARPNARSRPRACAASTRARAAASCERSATAAARTASKSRQTAARSAAVVLLLLALSPPPPPVARDTMVLSSWRLRRCSSSCEGHSVVDAEAAAAAARVARAAQRRGVGAVLAALLAWRCPIPTKLHILYLCVSDLPMCLIYSGAVRVVAVGALCARALSDRCAFFLSPALFLTATKPFCV